MKTKKFRIVRVLIAMVTVVCTAFTLAGAFAVNAEEDTTINYVSLGASNTNGYGIRGYLPSELTEDPLYADKSQLNVYGYNRAPKTAYPAQVAAWLEGVTGKDVELSQLAISSMRVEEVRMLLDNNYYGDSYTRWRFYDDNGKGWFAQAESQGAHNGAEALANLRSAYQTDIKNADYISVDMGLNNFGVFAFNNIKTIMADGHYWQEPDFTQIMDVNKAISYDSIKAIVNKYLEGNLSPELSSKLDMFIDTLAYATIGFCYNFDIVVGKIYELNPDANVIVVSIQNMLHGVTIDFEGVKIPIGDLYGELIDIANMYTASGSPYSNDYVFAYAGENGHATTFLDEILAWDGDPKNLTDNMKDCFDMYDDNLYVRSIIEYMMVGQALNEVFKSVREQAAVAGVTIFEEDTLELSYSFPFDVGSLNLDNLDLQNPPLDLKMYVAKAAPHLENIRHLEVGEDGLAKDEHDNFILPELYKKEIEDTYNAILEAKVSDIMNIFGESEEDATSMVKAEIDGPFNQIKDGLAEALYGVYLCYNFTLDNAYNVVATVVKEAAKIDTISVGTDSLNGFNSQADVLMNYIFNNVLGGAQTNFYYMLEKTGLSTTGVTAPHEFVMDEHLFDNPAVEAIAVLATRFELGNSFFAHPNEEGHDEITEAITNAILNQTNGDYFTNAKLIEAVNMLLTYVSENYEGIYELGYAEADKAGFIALAATKVAEFKEELEVVKAWVAEAKLPADIKAEINAEIAVAEATLAQIVEILANDKASTVAGLEESVKGLLATASESVEHLNHLIKLASDDAYELVTNKLNELQVELETLANKAIDETKAFAEEVKARIVEELAKAETELKEALAKAKAEVEAYVAEVTAEMNAELARIYAEIAAEITARIEAAVEYAEAVYTNVTDQVEYVVAQAKAIVEAVVAETKAKIAEVEAAINKVQAEVKAALAKVEEVSKEVYNEIVAKVDEVLSVAKAIASKVEMFEECLEEIEAIIKAEIEALPENVQEAIAKAEAKVLEYLAGKAAEFGAAYEAYEAVVKAYLEEIKAAIIEAYETAEDVEEFLVMAAAIIASEIDEIVEYVEGKYLEAKAVVEAVKAEIAEIIAKAQATYLEAKEALIEAQKAIESKIAEIKEALEIVKAEIEAALAEIKAESEEIYAKVMVEVEKAIAKAEALAKEVEAAIEYAEYLKGVILEQIEIAKGDLREALAEAKAIAEAKLAEIYAKLSVEAQKIYEEVTAKVFAEVEKAIAYAEYVYGEAEIVVSYVVAELEAKVAEINAELYAKYLEVEAVVRSVIENSDEIIASVLAEIEANKVEIIIALDEALNELAEVIEEVVAEVLSTYNGIRAEVRALIEMLGEHAPVEEILAAYDELTANIEDVLVAAGEDAIEVLKAYQKLSAFVKAVIERVCAEYEGEHFVATEDTKYLALGDSLVLATGLETGVSYSDKVAEALGLSSYELFGLPGFRTNDLHYLLNPEVGTDAYYETVVLPEMEGVVVEEISALMLEAVEASDIITLQVGANNFGAYALSQLVAYMSGEEMYEMDWDKYTGYELSEVAAEIKAEYTDDLLAYVYEQTGFAMPEEMLPMATTLLDVVLFTSLEYAANLEAIVDIIHERNEEAYLVLVGTYNPLREVYYDDGETAFEVGTLVEAVTSVIDAYIEQLAAEEENCVYVAINETEMILDTLPEGYVSKNLADTVEIPFVGVSVPEFLLEALGNDFETLHPSEAGHEYIKDQIIATISHEVSEEWTSDETGHWHACAGCDEQFDFAEHTFEWVVDEEAKPGVAGSKHEECTVCGYKQNEGTVIEALPEEHVHDMEKVPAKEASCTEKGNNEYYYCAGCDKYFKDIEGKEETTKEAEELPMTEHVYGEWVEVKPATEDEPGLEERTCVCGDKETREIPQLEHVHEMEVIKSTPSTCISHGNYKYYHCEKCDKYFKDAEGKEETTPADRVKPLGGHVGGQATCEERAQCIICGETYGAYGTHVLEYVAEVPATHKEAGTKAHYACECCGELQDAQGNVITEKDLVINKVPHSATGEWVSNETGHWHECSCGEQLDFTKHAFEWVIDEAAKPGVAGSKHEECKACGYKQNEGTEIPALPVEHVHDMEKVPAKEASCEEDGNNEYYYCAGCGKYFKDAEGKEETTKEAEVIKATGHTYGEWVVVKEATEDEPGLEERTCSCGEKETREIPQLPAKSKLSGGVIALIVVGSLAVLGGGGFALWFFFLKKKFVK